MPRILLSAAHIAPLVLNSIGLENKTPAIAAAFPALPQPFHATAQRVETLQKEFDLAAQVDAHNKKCKGSAKKPFCNDERSRPRSQSI